MRASSLVPAAILAAATLCAASGARADPTVSTAATRSVTCSGGVCTTTSASANLSILDLKTMLASGSVTLKPGSLSQNIVIAASVFWSNGSTLTLDAYKSIAIDMPIQVAGPGSLTMTTNDGGTGGLLTYDPKANITFLSLSSRLVIDGASFKLVNSIQALAPALAFNSVVNPARANSYDAKADGIYPAPPLNEADGIVDGLNNTISNLTVAVPSPGKLAGFLKELGTYATMRNFILTNAQVRADTGTGV